MMGRSCIRDHRPEQSLGNSEWLNGCAQCEVERLRANIGGIRMSLAAALGWPGGIGSEPPPLDEMLRMVADWRRRLTLASRATKREDHT